MSNPTFVIDCDDKRNEYIYAMLEKRGFGVIKMAFDNIFDAEGRYIFLFAPAARITIETAERLPKGSKIFCTDCCNNEVKRKLKKERRVSVFNYFDDENLAVRNAMLTAEGVLAKIIIETDRSIAGLNVLVLGGGRVGKCVAASLRNNGSSVSIVTRRADEYALIPLFADVAYSFEEVDKILHSFDVIINTVPSKILNKKRLSLLKKHCFVLDLASKPGGVDSDAASKLRINAAAYLNVPGKIAPKSAAEILLDSILKRVFVEIQ